MSISEKLPGLLDRACVDQYYYFPCRPIEPNLSTFIANDDEFEMIKRGVHETATIREGVFSGPGRYGVYIYRTNTPDEKAKTVQVDVVKLHP